MSRGLVRYKIENGVNKLIRSEQVAWTLWNTFQRRIRKNDEEWKCFVTPLHVIDQSQFPKAASISNPHKYNKVSLIWASWYLTLHMNAHKAIYLMAAKSDP